jgi:hypothetical protein
MARLRKWGYAPGGSEDMEEAFEERAAIIQFGSGREMSREEAERIAQEQMGRGKQ